MAANIGSCFVSVAVCIPTWNGERYIAETLTSVLGQTYEDFECLVVDDASTDRTLDIIRSFHDPRVRAHANTERLGIAGNSNRCLELVRSDYVCVFGHDDLMAPDNLARKVAVLAADPSVSFVHSTAEVLTTEPGPASYNGRYAACDRISDGNVRFRELLLGGNHICSSTVVARRQALLDAGGFDVELNYPCDYEMWMKLCANRRVAFLAEPLVKYRWHGENASHHFGGEQRVDEIHQAARRALDHYRQATGRDDADTLSFALEEVSKAVRSSMLLDQGKAWLESQVGNWRREAERLTQANESLIQANESLAQGNEGLNAYKAVLEQRIASIEAHVSALSACLASSQSQATDLTARLVSVERTRWVRLGRKLRVVPRNAQLSA
jgi:glycosyltransferase involved in cell wall biosynthesis